MVASAHKFVRIHIGNIRRSLNYFAKLFKF